MNKQFIFLGLLLVGSQLTHAQEVDDVSTRMNKLESQWANYVEKNFANKSTSNSLLSKELQKQRRALTDFVEDTPYFLQPTDIRQVRSADADYLNNGTMPGYSTPVNGNGILVTIFDGGRVYENHPAFNNLPSRITNKEASTEDYSAHSTGVSGFIGSKSITVTFNNVNYNTKGVASNTLINSYMFYNTVLPGTSNMVDVFSKILTANPNISNHSYGNTTGWSYRAADATNAGEGYYYIGSYNPTTDTYLDLSGAYYSNDRRYDELVYNNKNMIIVKSAGNSAGDGPSGSALPAFYQTSGSGINGWTQFPSNTTLAPNNCRNTTGTDCIGFGSLAKNIIVVGATNNLATTDNRYNSSANVFISSYSSVGPRDDGGIKPDIAAVGTSVAHPSTAEDTTGSVSYGFGSGTSYSAPVVSGVIALWQEMYQSLFGGQTLNAASAKTLLVHSAKEAGNPGPDATYGWGFANAKDGADILLKKQNASIIFNNETLNNAVPKVYLVTAGSQPIKATMSWVDPQYISSANTYTTLHNRRTSVLVNDLDLRIVDLTTGETFMPYKLNINAPSAPAITGDNTVDNVEQVYIPTPVAGRQYQVIVSNKGTLKNASGLATPQDYSIIVSGQTLSLATQEASINKNKMLVTPTITEDLVSILNAGDNATVEIYDMSGKKILTLKANNSEVVSLKNVPSGTYLIHITNVKGEKLTQKVIKK